MSIQDIKLASVIQAPIITEKSSNVGEANKYYFFNNRYFWGSYH